MSISPKGMNVTEVYRLFRDGNLLVNREYQRKLVWTEEEKRLLIDSILHGFPIPLILLVEHSREKGKYEIVDGVQRLNAIFSFIETEFDLNGEIFDLNEFSRARQLGDAGVFEIYDGDFSVISKDRCADILDYQLAVTIFQVENSEEINEILGE